MQTLFNIQFIQDSLVYSRFSLDRFHCTLYGGWSILLLLINISHSTCRLYQVNNECIMNMSLKWQNDIYFDKSKVWWMITWLQGKCNIDFLFLIVMYWKKLSVYKFLNPPVDFFFKCLRLKHTTYDIL
jgi:hypothetical protein